ncbi:MAG: hypothetical protein JO143_13495 [Acetobacteraceae bacterium]|nr:hypothetical protein [Acetobacteraceae bacterium]
MLGLTPLAPLNTLIVNPDLPEWLPEVTLRGVEVGAARADLRFWRDDSGFTNHHVERASGGLAVRRYRRPHGSGPDDFLAAAVREVIG